MPDQHVRYAFIKMNSEKMNRCDIESTLIKIRDDIQNLLDEIFEARKVDE